MPSDYGSLADSVRAHARAQAARALAHNWRVPWVGPMSYARCEGPCRGVFPGDHLDALEMVATLDGPKLLCPTCRDWGMEPPILRVVARLSAVERFLLWVAAVVKGKM